MRAHHRNALLLLAASLGFQALFLSLDAFVSDEGIVLVASHDVARGKLLYRDIDVPLVPLVYWIQGLVFSITGSHFLVSRLLIGLVNAGCIVAVYRLGRHLLDERRACAAAALTIPLVVWMWPHAHYFSYNQLTLLVCLVALERAWANERVPGWRNAMGLGAAFGVAVWLKPNLPVFLGLGVLGYWLLTWQRTRRGKAVVRARGAADIARDIAGVFAGMALVSLFPLAYLAATGTLDEMVAGAIAITRVYADSPTGLFPPPFPPFAQHDAVRLSPGLVLPGMLVNVYHGIGRDLLYQHLALFTGLVDFGVRLLYYVPVVMYAGVVAMCAREQAAPGPQRDAARLFTCGGIALYASNASFPAFHYITPTLLPLPLLALWGWSALRSERAGHWTARAIRWSGIVGIGGYLALSAAAVASYLEVPRAPVTTERGTFQISSETALLWNEMLEETERLMGPEDEIFVVPYFPLFYFMSGREHPTKYAALGPGLPGREATDAIIDTLDREGVDFALHVYGAEYPGLERFENAYPRLLHYLEREFELVRRFEGPARAYADLLRRRSP